MEKCSIRIDYDPRQYPEHFMPTEGPEDGRPQRLAMMFINEGHSVTLTHERHRNETPSGGDAVIIAPTKFAAEILQLLVEKAGFTNFYVDCG